MKIVLIRHGRVLLDWAGRCDSETYDRNNRLYDEAPIAPLPAMAIPIEKVYISELPRSAATAAFLRGGKSIEKTGLINEVPVGSFVDTRLRLPLWLWNVASTIQWLRGAPRAREALRDTQGRIDAFLELLAERGEDCIVVGHGMYFYRMMLTMKRRGYAGRIHRHMENGEVIEFESADGSC
jgi:broad specificity phosphatase PhoE